MSDNRVSELAKMRKVKDALYEKRVNMENELNTLRHTIRIAENDVLDAEYEIRMSQHKLVTDPIKELYRERENPIKELSMYGPKKSGDLKPEDFIVTAPKSDYDLPFTTETLLKIGRELGHFTLPRGANVISQVLKDRISQAFSHKSLKIEWGNTETIRIETVCDKLILVFSNVVMMENDLTCDQGETFEITSHQVGVMLGSLKE